MSTTFCQGDLVRVVDASTRHKDWCKLTDIRYIRLGQAHIVDQQVGTQVKLVNIPGWYKASRFELVKSWKDAVGNSASKKYAIVVHSVVERMLSTRYNSVEDAINAWKNGLCQQYIESNTFDIVEIVKTFTKKTTVTKKTTTTTVTVWE